MFALILRRIFIFHTRAPVSCVCECVALCFVCGAIRFNHPNTMINCHQIAYEFSCIMFISRITLNPNTSHIHSMCVLHAYV